MENINSLTFNSLIESCRTIHKFSDRQVDPALIEQALKNSLLAPNHKFTFPWKFYWVGVETKSKLIELATEIKSSKFADFSDEDKAKLAAKYKNPEIIVFTQKRHEDSFTSKEDYASLSCAVQLFALSLASSGVGYKWSTGKITRDTATYEILNIDVQNEEIIGFIFAGHAARPPGARKRPELSQVLVKTS